MRTRVVVLLLAAARKAVPWRPLASGAAVGLALAAIPAAAQVHLDAESHAHLLRLAALAGAIGATFMLDDPAHPVVSVTPVRKLLRHSMRVAVALPLAAGWWASVLLISLLGMDRDLRQVMPLPGITVEAMALLAIALTLSAAGMRRSESTSSGVASASFLLLIVVAIAALPDSVNPLVPPGDSRWGTAHTSCALMTAGMAVVFVLLSREPASTGSRRFTRRAA